MLGKLICEFPASANYFILRLTRCLLANSVLIESQEERVNLVAMDNFFLVVNFLPPGFN
jgi:hypothetical protein